MLRPEHFTEQSNLRMLSAADELLALRHFHAHRKAMEAKHAPVTEPILYEAVGEGEV